MLLISLIPNSARVGLALSASVAIHVAVLTIGQGTGAPPVADASAPRRVSIHLVQASAVAATPGLSAASIAEIAREPWRNAPDPGLSAAQSVGEAAAGANDALEGRSGQVREFSDDSDDGEVYLPASTVDRHAAPTTALDLSHLQSLSAYSGQIMRLRVFVNRTGVVTKAEVLAADPRDLAAADLVAQTLKETRFSPATRDGVEVSSYFDVDIELANDYGQVVTR